MEIYVIDWTARHLGTCLLQEYEIFIRDKPKHTSTSLSLYISHILHIVKHKPCLLCLTQMCRSYSVHNLVRVQNCKYNCIHIACSNSPYFFITNDRHFWKQYAVYFFIYIFHTLVLKCRRSCNHFDIQRLSFFVEIFHLCHCFQCDTEQRLTD